MFRFAAALFALVVASPLQAEVLLTVTESDGTVLAEYDLEALQALPARTIETTTVWTDGVQRFTGVPLSVLMAELAPEAQHILATAVNDYASEIPRADWENDSAMVAYLNGGEPMSLREKGPLWIVYPYDQDPAFRQEVIYARSIWQLDRIILAD